MKVAGVELNDARVLVIGMARSGLAAAGLLALNGARVTATDSRPLEGIAGAAEALRSIGAVVFTLQSDTTSEDHDLVVISPGVPIDAPVLVAARRAGIPVIAEVELASYFLQGGIIGVTGSNGKTTVTSLIGHILRESGIPVQVGGNIGTPPSSMVASSRPGRWNVLELSSFQLEAVSHFRASVGVCLNLTPDHLDRHGSMEVYAAAKRRLFETQDSLGYAVLNADDPWCVRYAAVMPSRPMWFSLHRPVTPGLWLEESGRLAFDGELFLEAAEIPLRGLHNVQNVLAAAGAARLAGASLTQITASVKTFPGVEHRLERVRALDGVEYFNDSKATNVDAALKAVDAFPDGLWIILGGKDKGNDFAPLREPLTRKARAALLIGAAAGKIAGQLEGALPLVDCGTIGEAVRYAHSHAKQNEVVLLAPACASFDQFDNFEHRGRVFKDLVMALEGETNR
jgi:UDP-N-acetylmuramoylalanine--D-glutamate ligase